MMHIFNMLINITQRINGQLLELPWPTKGHNSFEYNLSFYSKHRMSKLCIVVSWNEIIHNTQLDNVIEIIIHTIY